jgi:hypothetical protein
MLVSLAQHHRTSNVGAGVKQSGATFWTPEATFPTLPFSEKGNSQEGTRIGMDSRTGANGCAWLRRVEWMTLFNTHERITIFITAADYHIRLHG